MRLGLGLDALTEDRLIDGLLAHGHEPSARPESAAEIIELVRQRHVDALVLRSSERLLTAEVLRACDQAGVRVIALIGDREGRQQATAVGLHEVLDARCEWREVERLLVDAVGFHSPEPGRTDAGSTVIAVWGPAGAPGRSTLAINLASELADSGLSVVLADADSYAAAVAPMLGLLDEAPGFAAACRLAATEALTPHELERVAQHYGTGRGSFAVLTGIARTDRWPELAGDRVQRVLTECRAWADVTVIDVSSHLDRDEEISRDVFVPRRNGATLAAIDGADHVVAVGLADPLGVSRFLRGHAELLDTFSPRLHVVMNRLRAGAVGLGAAGQVRSTLARFGGIEQVDFVPDDQRSLDAAVLAGRTLKDAAPRSKARAAIQQITADRFGLVPPQTRARPRRSRRAGAQAID